MMSTIHHATLKCTEYIEKKHYIAAAIPLQTTMYCGDQFNKTMQYAIHALSGLFSG